MAETKRAVTEKKVTAVFKGAPVEDLEFLAETLQMSQVQVLGNSVWLYALVVKELHGNPGALAIIRRDGDAKFIPVPGLAAEKQSVPTSKGKMVE